MMGTTSKETYVEMTEFGDDKLLPWLDLYETSFPPTEKILVSDHLKVLKDKASGLAAEHHLLAALDEDTTLVAMARYQVIEERRAAHFWYLAVASHVRNRGIGRRFYSEVLRRAKDCGCEAMVYALGSLIPDQAFAMASDILGDRVDQTGLLGLA